MNDTLKMAKLDLLSMKPYLKSYAMLLGAMFVISLTGVESTFISFFLAVYMVMMAGSIFSVQEKGKLERLYGALALDGKSIVRGRYLFVLLHGLFAILIALPIALGYSLIRGAQFVPRAFALSSAGALALFAFTAALQLPFYFRFSYTKARMLVFLPFLLLFLAAAFLPRLAPGAMDSLAGAAEKALKNPQIGLAILAVAAVALVLASYKISLAMWRRARG